MSKLIETAVEHFSNKTVRKIEIPEWGVSVFAKNLTLDDKAKMLRRSDSDNTDFMIYTLIFGLVDEQGEPVFTIEDKVSLRKKVDPDVVTRVASFVLNSSSDEEDNEKNS